MLQRKLGRHVRRVASVPQDRKGPGGGRWEDNPGECGLALASLRYLRLTLSRLRLHAAVSRTVDRRRNGRTTAFYSVTAVGDGPVSCWRVSRGRHSSWCTYGLRVVLLSRVWCACDVLWCHASVAASSRRECFATCC
jgi:hypothetical protein